MTWPTSGSSLGGSTPPTLAEPSEVQPLAADNDVVRARQLVRTAALAVKLSLVDQTKLVTAASELARNTLAGTERRIALPITWDCPSRCGPER